MRYANILAVLLVTLATPSAAEEICPQTHDLRFQHALLCNDFDLAVHIAERFWESPEKGWRTFVAQNAIARVRLYGYMRGKDVDFVHCRYSPNASIGAAAIVKSLRPRIYADLRGRAIRYVIPIMDEPPYDVSGKESAVTN